VLYVGSSFGKPANRDCCCLRGHNLKLFVNILVENNSSVRDRLVNGPAAAKQVIILCVRHKHVTKGRPMSLSKVPLSRDLDETGSPSKF